MSGYNFDTPDGRRLLESLRRSCTHLPGVEEIVDGFGHRTFKVSGKSFVIAGMGVDGGSVSIKADRESQALLIRKGPWYRTPYIGQHGWVTIDAPLQHDWSEIAELMEDGYRLAAPRRLLRELDA
jgi:predicted DNA-binding protein (MmcQ/YjbR family)